LYVTVIIEWNVTEIPEALRDLPPGRYVVDSVEAPELTPEEDMGLRRALEDADAGRVRPLQEVVARARAVIEGQ
jgi:hypothetical protein